MNLLYYLCNGYDIIKRNPILWKRDSIISQDDCIKVRENKYMPRQMTERKL